MTWFRAIISLAALALTPAAAHGTDCAALASVRIADLTVSEASVTEARTPRPDRAQEPEPIGKSFCRVRGHIEAEIGFELWLPVASAWNGKLLAGGVGGEAGVLNYADMVRGLRRGYASTSTDTGHRIDDLDWALNRADRRTNFASRANHLLAVKAKALIDAYYGRPPRLSYFVGCSGGGREALKEMQAWPADFDGILAGGAGPSQLAVSMRLLWSQYVIAPRIAAILDDQSWQLVSDAGIRACDALDGVKDGVIGDPLACRFDPKALLCNPGRAAGCLTPSQIEAVSKLYAPLTDRAGKAIDAGLLPGVRVTLAPRSAFAFSLFGKVVHGDPKWDPATLDIATDMAAARTAWPDLPNDTADVSPFRNRGGKILYYHGWMDPWILAQQPIDYHRQVAARLGGADDFFRLFMVPGMGHCRGGPGADRFGGAGADAPVVDADHDMLSALEAWVEHGQAPSRIVASRVEDGRATRTRPLCPFPQVAVYRGHGSTDLAANFACQKRTRRP